MLVGADDRGDGGLPFAPSLTRLLSDPAEGSTLSHTEEQYLRGELKRIKSAGSGEFSFSGWGGTGLLILAATSVLLVLALARGAN